MSPLIKGRGKKLFSQNIKEFLKGKKAKKTAKKFGKKKAISQAVAVAYKQAGETGFNKRSTK